MATNAGAGASRQLASATKATAVWKVRSTATRLRDTAENQQKYTVQSNGVWERIRRALAVDPNRSTGVPLNPQYRNPPPGANPPEAYDDPVTVPSGDIAENAYYKRDIRRSYPRLSVVKQADVVGLLSVGSKANPKDDVLQIGDAGAKQLIQVKQDGKEKGLAAFFEKGKDTTASIFGPDGLPPFPSGMSRTSAVGGRKYIMDADREEGYPEECVPIAPCLPLSASNADVQIPLPHFRIVPSIHEGFSSTKTWLSVSRDYRGLTYCLDRLLGLIVLPRESSFLFTWNPSSTTLHLSNK